MLGIPIQFHCNYKTLTDLKNLWIVFFFFLACIDLLNVMRKKWKSEEIIFQKIIELLSSFLLKVIYFPYVHAICH